MANNKRNNEIKKIGEPVIGEYKGHKTLSIPVNPNGDGLGFPFSFGKAKAIAIVENIGAIEEFALSED